jgi:hypothetical protein
MVVRRLCEVRDDLRSVTAALDPEALRGGDVAEAVAVCSEIERLAVGARTLLAERVEATRAWVGGGKRSAAHWLAEQAGTSVGEASAVMRTAKHLEDLPSTRDALRDGRLSSRQAEWVAQGAAADPSAEGALLDLAGRASLGELRQEAQRTIAAAERDEAAAYQRVRRSRFFRHRREADGAWVGTLRTTADCGALVLAAINEARPAIFDAARRSGSWDSSEAYDADALVALAAHFLGAPPSEPSGAAKGSDAAQLPVDGHAVVQGDDQREADEAAQPGVVQMAVAEGDAKLPPTSLQTLAAHFPGLEVVSATSAQPAGPQSSCHPPAPSKASAGSLASLVIRVDHSALARGHLVPGEQCEIAGIGPVGVDVVRRLLGKAFLAAVATDEHGEPVRVAHLGRDGPDVRTFTQQLDDTPTRIGGEPPTDPTVPPACARSVLRALGRRTKIIVGVRAARLESDPEPADALLQALARHGTPVVDLVHHKRGFSALQRTALEYRDPECTVLGCTATARLELDHRADWAATHTTDACCADRLCHFHHDLKTRAGWQLEAGTGKRRMLPPARSRDAP